MLIDEPDLLTTNELNNSNSFRGLIKQILLSLFSCSEITKPLCLKNICLTGINLLTN